MPFAETSPLRTQSAIEYLQGLHAAFRFLEQDEDTDSAWMCAHHHPYATEYRVYRTTFESLEYASGIGTRYLAFFDRRNWVDLVAPRLRVTWAPTNIAGLSGEFSPSSDPQRWKLYLHTLVQHGWPEACEPSLYSGSWRFKTDVKDFYDDLRKTVGAQAEVLEPGFWQVECYNPSEASVARLFHVVRGFFSAAPLPPPKSIWSHDEDPITVPLAGCDKAGELEKE